MSKRTCRSKRVKEWDHSLDERLARLRSRHAVLTALIDSLATYARTTGHESDPTTTCDS